jgi:hypothetical protein
MIPPFVAMNVWQSMDVTLDFISVIIIFGGGAMLITLWVMCARLGHIKYSTREAHVLLKYIAELMHAEKTAKDCSTSSGQGSNPTKEKKEAATPPPVPAGVYKLD